MPQTAMSEAFAKAGVISPVDRLAALARDAWSGRDGERDQAKRRRYITTSLRAEMTWAAVEATEGGNAVLARAVGEALQRAWDEIEAAKPPRKRAASKQVDHHPPMAPSKAAARRIAALEKTAIRLSKLDTFIVNGHPIGDLTPIEALGWAMSRERDVRFVRMLVGGLPVDRPIRDSLTGEEADGMWENAERGSEMTARKKR
jgi:hypothetical protein